MVKRCSSYRFLQEQHASDPQGQGERQREAPRDTLRVMSSWCAHNQKSSRRFGKLWEDELTRWVRAANISALGRGAEWELGELASQTNNIPPGFPPRR